MAATTIGLKIDDPLRERLRLAADRLGRTPHWLIKQSVLHALDRIERGETPFLGAGRARRTTGRRRSSPSPSRCSRNRCCAPRSPPRPGGRSRNACRCCCRRRRCRRRRPPQAEATARRLVRGAARQGRERAGRGADPGIRAVQPGRHRADVPGRGAAAHPRPRHPRRADPRQDRPAATGMRISARSKSLFVNAATWGLLVTGRLTATSSETGLTAALARLIGRGGEPLIRRGVDVAMRHDGRAVRHRPDHQRGAGQRRRLEARGFRYSYDMLGEAAMTAADAARYLRRLRAGHPGDRPRRRRARHRTTGPGISVKLSALHPRYSRAQRERVMAELLPRAAAVCACWRATLRHRPEHRRRGSRPAGPLARPAGGAVPRPGAGRLGRHRLRRAGLSEARAVRDRLCWSTSRGAAATG